MKKPKWPRQHYDEVRVLWDDAAGLRHGWMDRLEVPKPQLAMSKGYLIVDNPDYIIIAQDTDGDGGHNGRTQIPRGMVRRIQITRKKDPPSKEPNESPPDRH